MNDYYNRYSILRFDKIPKNVGMLINPHENKTETVANQFGDNNCKFKTRREGWVWMSYNELNKIEFIMLIRRRLLERFPNPAFQTPSHDQLSYKRATHKAISVLSKVINDFEFDEVDLQSVSNLYTISNKNEPRTELTDSEILRLSYLILPYGIEVLYVLMNELLILKWSKPHRHSCLFNFYVDMQQFNLVEPMMNNYHEVTKFVSKYYNPHIARVNANSLLKMYDFDTITETKLIMLRKFITKYCHPWDFVEELLLCNKYYSSILIAPIKYDNSDFYCGSSYGFGSKFNLFREKLDAAQYLRLIYTFQILSQIIPEDLVVLIMEYYNNFEIKHETLLTIKKCVMKQEPIWLRRLIKCDKYKKMGNKLKRTRTYKILSKIQYTDIIEDLESKYGIPLNGLKTIKVKPY